MDHRHGPLLVHPLLGAQDHPQPGGGEVEQLLQVQGQVGDAVQAGAQLGLQLGGGGGVQTPLRVMVRALPSVFLVMVM